MTTHCEPCANGAFCFAHSTKERDVAAQQAREARRDHADLRTRFAVALAANGGMARTARDACPRCGHATSLYDRADELAREDARRREADGAK